MPDFDWSFIIQLAVAIGTSVGIYVAIRIDLAILHEKVAAAHEKIKDTNDRVEAVTTKIEKVHERIDGWYRSEPRN